MTDPQPPGQKILLLLAVLSLPACAAGGADAAMDGVMHLIKAPYHYIFDDEDDPMAD